MLKINKIGPRRWLGVAVFSLGILACRTLPPPAPGSAPVHKEFSAPESETTFVLPQSPEAYASFLKARLAFLDGDTQTAIENYEAARKLNPESLDINLRLAQLLLGSGKLSEVLPLAEELVKKHPRSTEAHILLGSVDGALRRIDPAIDEYRQVLKLDPKKTESHLYLGSLLAEKKESAEAEKEFLIFVAVEPQSPLGYYYLGRMSAERKDWPKAENYYQKAIERQPSFLAALIELGIIFEFQKKSDQAVELYQKALRYFPENPRILERLGQIYISRNDYKGALEKFQEQERFDTDNLDLRVKIGLLEFEEGNLDQAIEEFSFVLTAEPGHPTARYYLAAAYLKSGARDKAREELEKIESSSSFYPEARIQIAMMQEENNDTAGAILTVQAALEKMPGEAGLQRALAHLFFKARRFAEAKEVVEQGLKLKPDDVTLLYLLGEVYDFLDQDDLCIETMKKVLKLDPKHADALNYIGYLYAEKGIKLEEALGLLKKALEIRPNDGFITDSLGWAYYQQKNYRKALELIERAFSLIGDDPTIAEHLGDVHSALGEREKAIRDYKNSLQLKPEPDKDLKRIEEKLKRLENAN
ncbi:MAG: tetratricopeptide repeat protein [bacterium]|nr:tetratricopeptide repeat protein [bacterium]